MVITQRAGSRNDKKLMALGVVAVVILAAVAFGGSYWWKQHNEPSQASEADCALAQKIIDEAQKLPRDKAAVTKWQHDMHNLREAKMKDGYLGLQVSLYEAWAADRATGQGATPTKKEQAEMVDRANSHCTDAKRALVFPTIAS